ncbi:hypothetical protein EJB05_48618, partial [Eragrostis curvula]
MFASRAPVSLHHRIVAGGQRRRCIAGKHGRAAHRHFTQALESMWRRSPQPPAPPAAAAARTEDKARWQPPPLENAAFEEYYKMQGIVREEEWDAFMSVLRTPLPATFRINASRQCFKDIRSKLESDFRKSLETEVSNEYKGDAIMPMAWYPDNLAWHLNFSRKDLRKNQALESYYVDSTFVPSSVHEFLKHESEVGNITRQEAVSMVPPLFLNVKPDHHILDMCAAPGSKTFQLLEMIHQSVERGPLPGALVQFSQAFSHTHKPQSLEFDRVLCDVPCCGDGTIRKGHNVWRTWNSGMGNELHRLQVEIAMRGLALTKVGGRMVYSTCSMNPVENEAVVAELLRRSGNSVELLDVSNELPGLVRRPGLITWKVSVYKYNPLITFHLMLTLAKMDMRVLNCTLPPG